MPNKLMLMVDALERDGADDDAGDDTPMIEHDLLLMRLIEVHGLPRYDIPPALLRYRVRYQAGLVVDRSC